MTRDPIDLLRVLDERSTVLLDAGRGAIDLLRALGERSTTPLDAGPRAIHDGSSR